MLKKGKIAIEFAIKKDGHVTDMRLVAPPGTSTLIIGHGAVSPNQIHFHRCPASSLDHMSRCAPLPAIPMTVTVLA